MVFKNGYPPLKSSYDQCNHKSVPGEARPLSKLEIYFIVEGQIPKFALNNFLKMLLKLRKFTTPMWVGEISPNFASKQANAIQKNMGGLNFYFQYFLITQAIKKCQKKGTGQHTVWKKSCHVNEINFLSKRFTIKVQTAHHLEAF